MEFIQSNLRKLLLALVAIAGPADVSMFDVPRLVAEARATGGRGLQAISVTGTWRGTTVQGRRVTLDVKADGPTLTGRLTLDERSAVITDGKIEQSTISFRATFDGRTAAFTGDVAGDEITLALDGARNPVTLKRGE
jgi:hypothetical protein